ncbi:hypothetical protein [Xanthomonas phage JGB6]|nr:hypothetical protein [Xanthomonas phage JGB6]
MIEKTGSGMGTEYTVTPSPKASKIDAAVLTKAKNLEEWSRQEAAAELAKALTSVRVITGTTVPAASSAPRLSGPSKATSRLSDLSTDDLVQDAEFAEVDTTPKSSGSDDIDDFLKDL